MGWASAGLGPGQEGREAERQGSPRLNPSPSNQDLHHTLDLNLFGCAGTPWKMRTQAMQGRGEGGRAHQQRAE